MTTIQRAASDRSVDDQREGTERAVGDIWMEVLSLQAVQPTDDFIALGGDSVAAKRMMLLIEERLGVTLALPTLFEAPTLGALAAKVDAIRHQTGRANG
jgi:acyl carrier protein